MLDAADQLFLRRAIEVAERGMFSVTANPRVGCLLVKNGVLLGSGAHLRAGQGHAEVNALADARRRHTDTDIAGATAYVSLEPCCHAGRTPACTDALLGAGVSRVVVAKLDPHPKVAGEGVAKLRAAGVTVDVEALPEAERLIYGHATNMRLGRPYIRIKIAQSLDGATAMASGESKWITGPLARRDVQYWRARSCAVITGAGTVVADDPALTVRDDVFASLAFGPDGPEGTRGIRQPLRVVLDSQRRASADSTLFTDGHPTLWLTAQDGAASDADGRIDIPSSLAELAQNGCNEVLVEAGSELVGAFLRLDLWDELLVYTAPKVLGSDARPMAQLTLASMSEAVEGKIASVDLVGTDVRTRLVRPSRDIEHVDVVPLGYPNTFLDKPTE